MEWGWFRRLGLRERRRRRRFWRLRRWQFGRRRSIERLVATSKEGSDSGAKTYRAYGTSEGDVRRSLSFGDPLRIGGRRRLEPTRIGFEHPLRSIACFFARAS